jgi:Arc/MetJ-type ribon-helix-helix transcriptional regulator
MRRTTITLPDDLAELVDSEARRQHTSVSDVIRQAVVKSLTGSPEKPREIPFAGLFHDPHMVPGERLEEALADRWADDIDRDRG